MTIAPGLASVTLVRRQVTGRDAYGQDVYTPSETTVTGCAVLPASSGEQLGSADRIVTRYELYAPAGTDVDAVDAVVLADGTRWEIDGEPERWPDAFGNPHHVRCYLRRVTG